MSVQDVHGAQLIRTWDKKSSTKLWKASCQIDSLLGFVTKPQPRVEILPDRWRIDLFLEHAQSDAACSVRTQLA